MRLFALLFIVACGAPSVATTSNSTTSSATAEPTTPASEVGSETPGSTDLPPNVPEVFSGNAECQSNDDCTVVLTCCSENVRAGTEAQLVAWNAVCARSSCLAPETVPDLDEFAAVCVNSACETQQAAP